MDSTEYLVMTALTIAGVALAMALVVWLVAAEEARLVLSEIATKMTRQSRYSDSPIRR